MDAYTEILQHMRTQGMKYNPPTVQLGKMITSNILSLGDLQITKKNLLVADYLLPNYKRKIKIPSTNATGTAGEHSISSIGIPDGEISYTDTLKAGDLVAVMPTADGQKYIILCKVVEL